MPAILLYLPVIHEGYLKLFREYPEHDVWILGEGIMEEHNPMTRDLRKIPSAVAAEIVQSLGRQARVVEKTDLQQYNQQHTELVLPDETEMHALHTQLFPLANVEFVKTFLRWDKTLTTTETIVAPDRVITTNELHRAFLLHAKGAAEQSADWWRQVGAALVINGRVHAMAHNQHLPTDYHLAQNGDPRVNVNAGERPDLYTSIHAEATVIAQAARHGLATSGADIYVTTFPCPNCARLIGEAGIRTVYYEKGFSRLDGEAILKAIGVQIVLVTPPDTVPQP
jgi:dCMP deaminase